MKICSTCGQKKAVSEFYADKRRLDGLYSRCKSCHLKATQAYARTEKGKQIQRNYWLSERGHETHRKAAHKYSKTEKGRVTARRWARKNWRKYYDPKDPKRWARWTVENAIRAGKLVRTKNLNCQQCSKKAKGYHHHLGYEKKHWLDVIPLCDPCHKLAHI